MACLRPVECFVDSLNVRIKYITHIYSLLSCLYMCHYVTYVFLLESKGFYNPKSEAVKDKSGR